MLGQSPFRFRLRRKLCMFPSPLFPQSLENGFAVAAFGAFLEGNVLFSVFARERRKMGQNLMEKLRDTMGKKACKIRNCQV